MKVQHLFGAQVAVSGVAAPRLHADQDGGVGLGAGLGAGLRAEGREVFDLGSNPGQSMPIKLGSMPPYQKTPALERLTRLLIDGADDDVLDRILLDAIWSLEDSGSVALMRADASGELRTCVSHGEPSLLPDSARVKAHLAGTRPLGGELHVMRAFTGELDDSSALVLVLAEWHDSEAIEAANTLLDLCASCSRQDSASTEFPLPALPATNWKASERELAHDLRNHLAGLRTVCDVLDVLEQELEEDELDHYGAVLTRECKRAGQLLASALECAGESECNGSELETALTDVLVAEVAAYRHEHAEIETRLDARVREAIYRMSAVDFGRVVRNLLVNAREACASLAGPVTRVLIECQPDRSGRGGLVLTVEDDGPGVDLALRERLFEEGSTTKASPDSGLGLAGVNAMVAAAGGEVRVQHLPQRGTRFQIWIPKL